MNETSVSSGPIDGINVVQIENLTVTIGARNILDNVNLEVKAGSFTGLVGPNGAGKTTLLKVLLGLIEPDAGSIRLFGHSPGQAHNLIGYVPQSGKAAPDFPVSARDVVTMGLYSKLGLGRSPGKDGRAAVDEALRLVDAADLAGEKFGGLSGGEKQKIFIARALCAKPKLLLLDEPTTGVDVLAQDNFYAMLKSLIDNFHMTILLVSHDIGVITSMVDDLICINQKVFCHSAPPDALASGLIGSAYGCEAEILMHGHSVPHRVVNKHDHDQRPGPEQ